MSSYATTLNILFFYMTWSTLVWSHPPLRVEILSTGAFRMFFFVLPSILFFLFDVLTPSAAVIVKAHGEAGLPGGRKRFKLRLKEFKIAGWSIFNVCLALVMQAAVEWFLTRFLRVRSAIRVSTRIPSPWTIMQDIFLGLLFREVSLNLARCFFGLSSLADVTCVTLPGSHLSCASLCTSSPEVTPHQAALGMVP